MAVVAGPSELLTLRSAWGDAGGGGGGGGGDVGGEATTVSVSMAVLNAELTSKKPADVATVAELTTVPVALAATMPEIERITDLPGASERPVQAPVAEL